MGASICDLHWEKTPFHSRHAAERSRDNIRRMGERRESGKKPDRAYLCERCKRWYLTSLPA